MSGAGGTAVLSRQAASVARPTAHLLSSIPSSRFERALGVLVMFVACYSVPNAWLASGREAVGGAASTQVVIIYAAVAAFGFTSMRFDIGPVIDLIRGEVLLPLLVIFTLASTMWSSVPDVTFRLAVNIAATTVVAFWLSIRFPVSTIIGMAGVAFGLGTLLQAFMIRFTPAYAAFGDVWVGVLKDRNVFGRSVSLAILVLLLCWRIFPRYRLLTWGMIAMNLLFLYKADSKTSTVAAAALPVMFAIFTVFRARRTLYGAVAIVMGVASVAVFALGAVNSGRLAEALDRSPTLSSRTPIWETVVPEIKDDPVIGHALAGFFTDDWAGPAGDVYRTLGTSIPHAHNALLNMLLDLGIVGAGLFLVIFLKLVVRGSRIVRYYSGPVGMFPLMFAGYLLLNSITEYGLYTGDLHFMLYVVAICAALPGRRDELSANVPAFARTRQANSSALRRPSVSALPPQR